MQNIDKKSRTSRGYVRHWECNNVLDFSREKAAAANNIFGLSWRVILFSGLLGWAWASSRKTGSQKCYFINSIFPQAEKWKKCCKKGQPEMNLKESLGLRQIHGSQGGKNLSGKCSRSPSSGK